MPIEGTVEVIGNWERVVTKVGVPDHRVQSERNGDSVVRGASTGSGNENSIVLQAGGGREIKI